jgi:hypothetical protein
VLGVSDVWFLGYPDGSIEPSYALRRDITWADPPCTAHPGAHLKS